MKVADILRTKESRVVTVRSGESIEEAIRLMKAENISALVVKDVCRTEGNAVAGMLSERDIVYALLERGASVLKTPVFMLMSRTIQTCAPDDSLQHVLELMDQHHIRHLPVLDGTTLVGVVSARDLTKLQLADLTAPARRAPPEAPAYAH
ncbi:CBS domain-containing protein [Azospirillum canadense]|uniref:CBS domain-containing protein n=1 Tax=Azospirillum canadense TaxID=403962 RepID=UPI002226DA84|nr:CBS domain-containing protein [Azospirillum canadense]MCW2236899.1 CBS domain-containing protein [Azospirillum canadense]